MKNICGIYKITSPNENIYIGQSIHCNRRKNKYKNGGESSQSRLYNSIHKYGWDNHKFEIIHTCEQSELNQLEIYYISLFQSFNSAHGLNLKAGGQQGGICSDETKAKIAASRIGRKLSDEHKKKISEAGIGRVFSIESRLKKSKSLKGKIRTAEHSKNISIGHTGRKLSDETRKRMSNSHNGIFNGNRYTKNITNVTFSKMVYSQQSFVCI